MMPEIKAILVDYSGVLVDSPSTSDTFARVAHEMGVSEIFLKEGVYGKNRELWNRAKLGFISEAEHWATVEKNLGVSANQVQWIKAQLFESPQLHQTFLNFLKSLGDRYSLALVSNAIPVFTQTWVKLGFNNWFDVMINSSLVNLAKPDPEIYELALKHLNLQPEDCIVVDDLTRNLSTAADLGFRIVHYTNENQAIAAIKQLIAYP